MKSAIINNPKDIKIVDIEIPALKENEVLIKMLGCGICGSNLPVWEGREWFHYPLEPGSPGHEGWGIIDKIGSLVTKFKQGDLVTAITYHAFAEFDITKEDSVIKLPSEFNNSLFPGEPLGCAVNIFNRSNIKSDDYVVVIGIGFIGALIIPLIKNAGAKVIAINRSKGPLESAKKLGADYVIQFDDYWKNVDEVKSITNQNLADVVIEATGVQEPLNLAGDLTKVRGRLVIAGYHQDGMRQVNMQMWNWKGLDVINAHERDPKVYVKGIQEAVQYVQKGILKPEDLFTHIYRFDEIKKGFETAARRPEGFIKSIIIFN